MLSHRHPFPKDSQPFQSSNLHSRFHRHLPRPVSRQRLHPWPPPLRHDDGHDVHPNRWKSESCYPPRPPVRARTSGTTCAPPSAWGGSSCPPPDKQCLFPTPAPLWPQPPIAVARPVCCPGRPTSVAVQPNLSVASVRCPFCEPQMPWDIVCECCQSAVSPRYIFPQSKPVQPFANVVVLGSLRCHRRLPQDTPPAGANQPILSFFS